ncbi:MAG: DUF4124 domain-containing protein [Xanthomonadales bacterium]|nr:DUF4124 domain-containing protein [Xanthomonadales bacterium]
MKRNGKQKGFCQRFASALAITLLGALIGANAASAQEKRVYRWVDEDGNVHYLEP